MKVRNQRGAVLGWVMIVLLVVMTLLCSMLALSSGYYKRTLRRMMDHQAAYTARSVVEAIATELKQNSFSDDSLSSLLVNNPAAEIMVGGLDEAMGICTVVSNYESGGNLHVTATVKLDEHSQSMTVVLRPLPELDIPEREEVQEEEVQEEEVQEEEIPVRWEVVCYQMEDSGGKEEN